MTHRSLRRHEVSQMRKLPILKSLHLFETVSEFPSFSRAAERLNMTTGAVSYQMRLLEDWFGRRLFVRHSSGVRLTSEPPRDCRRPQLLRRWGRYEQDDDEQIFN
ncbi:helix-turn-helix domain-containing protein [Bradyrhizobium elkanii]